jgi:hypothetical protein
MQKKPIKFHNNFEEQKEYGSSYSEGLDATARLSEMYRLNEKVFGKKYWEKHTKKVEVFRAKQGESVEAFYKRINSND